MYKWVLDNYTNPIYEVTKFDESCSISNGCCVRSTYSKLLKIFVYTDLPMLYTYENEYFSEDYPFMLGGICNHVTYDLVNLEYIDIDKKSKKTIHDFTTDLKRPFAKTLVNVFETICSYDVSNVVKIILEYMAPPLFSCSIFNNGHEIYTNNIYKFPYKMNSDKFHTYLAKISICINKINTDYMKSVIFKLTKKGILLKQHDSFNIIS
jgi:hypothetical protein